MEPADSDLTTQQRRTRRPSPRASSSVATEKSTRHRHGSTPTLDFDDADESHLVRGYD